MRRAIVATVAVLAAGVLAWEFIPITKLIHDGGYNLTVHVESQAGQPKSVSCQTFGTREDADDAVTWEVTYLQPPQWPRYRSVADPFNARPLAVEVPVCWGESPFGRTTGRGQFRFLVVIATLAGGRRVSKVVDIPDGRVSREVTVELP